MAKSSGNTVTNNNAVRNDYGSYLVESSNNTIYHNDFINNSKQVYSSYDSINIWDDGYPSGGNHWSDYNGTDLFSGPYQNMTGSDGIGDTPYTIDENNIDHYLFMEPWIPPDIAVTNIMPLKTIVGLGYSVPIDVTVQNQGNKVEGFNLTTYANTTIINQLQITLTGRSSTTLTFLWNTTGVSKGDYTINAHATTVLGEIDAADNTYVDGWVMVTIAGDMDGDFDVDFDDIVAIAMAYGSKPSDSNWNPNADLGGDGDVDFDDVVIAAMNYGKSDC